MTQAGPKQRITVDLPWELYRWLQTLDQSMNTVVVQAVTKERERQEKEQGT